MATLGTRAFSLLGDIDCLQKEVLERASLEPLATEFLMARRALEAATLRNRSLLGLDRKDDDLSPVMMQRHCCSKMPPQHTRMAPAMPVIQSISVKAEHEPEDANGVAVDFGMLRLAQCTRSRSASRGAGWRRSRSPKASHTESLSSSISGKRDRSASLFDFSLPRFGRFRSRSTSRGQSLIGSVISGDSDEAENVSSCAPRGTKPEEPLRACLGSRSVALGPPPAEDFVAIRAQLQAQAVPYALLGINGGEVVGKSVFA